MRLGFSGPSPIPGLRPRCTKRAHPLARPRLQAAMCRLPPAVCNELSATQHHSVSPQCLCSRGCVVLVPVRVRKPRAPGLAYLPEPCCCPPSRCLPTYGTLLRSLHCPCCCCAVPNVPVLPCPTMCPQLHRYPPVLRSAACSAPLPTYHSCPHRPAPLPIGAH